jgi:hypothetical protein
VQALQSNACMFGAPEQVHPSKSTHMQRPLHTAKVPMKCAARSVTLVDKVRAPELREARAL